MQDWVTGVTGPVRKHRDPYAQLILWDPRPEDICSPSGGFGAFMGSPLNETCLENLREPDQKPKPPQPAHFEAKEQRLYLKFLSDDAVFDSISKAKQSHPMEEAIFCGLHPESHSFGHDLHLVTIMSTHIYIT
ncbi:hypothetical protein ILYODFUR_037181 [Ilyodon furcidens]|uniref:Uncharacterized protein n=1 Tax=Ilyodon furcidens TaxID=33524 RepID=A0ABV0TE88_9TELE